ncbi:hypothetical protein [Sphingobacterium composti Ten et al. 2007 non Yoo et al. 2007]|uniref:hypothetical protein n=1 Tax=Sphingobacterium composti TaxID=363260 RepID=UPI001359C26F|nr:hypothetical protein [Sphingobacterium composti Ten et al. 2007 non Yoo et al. 2007]
MKFITKIFALFLFVLFAAACSDDNEKYVTESQAKTKISNDLDGTSWKVKSYSEILRNEKGEKTGEVVLKVQDSPITGVIFQGGLIEILGQYKGNYAYNVTSVTWGYEQFPDPHILTLKTNFAHYYIMNLNHAYTQFSADMKLKSDNKTYNMSFTKE